MHHLTNDRFCDIITSKEKDNSDNEVNMKIQFLGTGAADWPKIREEGKNEHRRLSSSIVDGILLIDPGPCVFDAMGEYGIDPAQIKYVINTHSHGDHFSQDTLDKLLESGAEFFRTAAGDEVEMGAYKVRALKANHGTCPDAVHFLISDGEKTLFYGLDGAWLLYEEYVAIKNSKPDLAVLDATIGGIDGDFRIFEHNNLAMVLEMKKTLDKYVKKFYISHMARTLHTDHKTLCDHMSPFGVGVARDGLEVEF